MGFLLPRTVDGVEEACKEERNAQEGEVRLFKGLLHRGLRIADGRGSRSSEANGQPGANNVVLGATDLPSLKVRGRRGLLRQTSWRDSSVTFDVCQRIGVRGM